LSGKNNGDGPFAFSSLEKKRKGPSLDLSVNSIRRGGEKKKEMRSKTAPWRGRREKKI